MVHPVYGVIVVVMMFFSESINKHEIAISIALILETYELFLFFCSILAHIRTNTHENDKLKL